LVADDNATRQRIMSYLQVAQEAKNGKNKNKNKK